MKSRSIFWPLILIAVGLVWLFINLGTLPSENLWALYSFVPYFILLLGVGLVLRARWELAGRILSSLAIGLAVLAIVFAAPLGWNKPPEWGCFWASASDRECNWLNIDGGSIPGSGVVVSEQRPVGEFTAVSVDYPSEVLIRQGETSSVTIEAEDNVLPQLETRLANGVLIIEGGDIPYGERVNPTRTVHVTLTVPDLTQLDFSSAGMATVQSLQTDALVVSLGGAGQVRLLDLDVQRLRVNLSGAGEVEAGGAADSLQVDLSGLGSFSGAELKCLTADGEISGMGSATVWVTQQLTIEISGTGSLEYYGSPEVRQTISGLGSVQGLGDK